MGCFPSKALSGGEARPLSDGSSQVPSLSGNQSRATHSPSATQQADSSALSPLRSRPPTEQTAAKAGMAPRIRLSSRMGTADNDTHGASLSGIQPFPFAQLQARCAAFCDGGKTTVNYVPPMLEEVQAYRTWISDTATAARSGQHPTATPPEGFVLEPFSSKYWIAHEHPDHRRGAGAVIFRLGDGPSILLETPHVFFDRGTMDLGIRALEILDARALLINTVHRNRALMQDGVGTSPASGVVSPSDAANATPTFFLAAHEALIADGGATLQLHGFRDEKAPQASVIVSASGTNGRIDIDALRQVVQGGVRVFPEEINMLGALRNVEARACRERKLPFVHVEIAKSLRDELASSDTLQRRFLAALAPVQSPD